MVIDDFDVDVDVQNADSGAIAVVRQMALVMTV